MKVLELISMGNLCFEEEQLPEVMRSFSECRAKFMSEYEDGNKQLGIGDYVNSFRRFINYFNDNSKYYIHSYKSMIIDYYYDDIEEEITFNDLANQEDISEEDANRLAEKCVELKHEEGINDAIFVLHSCEINERKSLGIIRLK